MTCPYDGEPLVKQEGYLMWDSPDFSDAGVAHMYRCPRCAHEEYEGWNIAGDTLKFRWCECKACTSQA